MSSERVSGCMRKRFEVVAPPLSNHVANLARRLRGPKAGQSGADTRSTVWTGPVGRVQANGT